MMLRVGVVRPDRLDPWPDRSGQAPGLTGQARPLACQAGLTGRLAFGNPGQQVSSNLFIMHLPCMQLRAIYALQSIQYRSGAVMLSCTILSCIMLNSLIADYDSIIGSCIINRMYRNACMHG